MDKKQVRRQFWWLENWQLAEQEAWLEEMSRNGWHLVKTDFGLATFEKGPLRNYRYRCDVFNADHWSERERLELYQEAGWEHVADRGLVQIFRAPEDDAIPEIHTDPVEQAKNIRRLLPGHLTSFLVPLLFMALGILVYKPSLAELLLGFDWLVALACLFLFAWIILSVVALWRLARHIISLLRVQQPPRSVKWRSAMGRAQVRGVLILVTWLFLLGGRLAEPLLATQPDFPLIPEIDLPVVRLSQIMDESQYASSIRNEGYFKDKGDVWNYYRLESSLPVPEQHYLAESVELRSGGSEATNVYFHCDAYRAISPGVAKALANSIAEGRKLYPYRSSLPLRPASDTRGFAGLWLLEDEGQLEVITCQGHWVYHLSCAGNVSLEQMLQALKLHIMP